LSRRGSSSLALKNGALICVAIHARKVTARKIRALSARRRDSAESSSKVVRLLRTVQFSTVARLHFLVKFSAKTLATFAICRGARAGHAGSRWGRDRSSTP
jgi:hypothetical protein